MITEPLDYNEELKRIPGADYELCTALLSMMVKEDHFVDDQVFPVLERMKDVLSTGA